jgi:hypothetical protein
MKYPELAQVSYTLPAKPGLDSYPKLIPIPNINIPDVTGEHASLKQWQEYNRQKEELKKRKEEKLRIEKAKKEAFSKVLIPEKSESISDLSAAVQKQGPDLSEFESFSDSPKQTSAGKPVDDFKALKEIMGVSDVKISQEVSGLPAPKQFQNFASSSVGSSPQSSPFAYPIKPILSNPTSYGSSPQSLQSNPSPPRFMPSPPKLPTAYPEPQSYGRRTSSPQHGNPPPVPQRYTPEVSSILSMGFTKEQATEALERYCLYN